MEEGDLQSIKLFIIKLDPYFKTAFKIKNKSSLIKFSNHIIMDSASYLQFKKHSLLILKYKINII